MHSSCDERCLKASGSSCDCECGGANHGGFTKAVDRTGREHTTNMSDRQISKELESLAKRESFITQELEHSDPQDEPGVYSEYEKERTSIRDRSRLLEAEAKKRKLLEGGGTPEPGSVSTGTLKSDDLLNSFRSKLEDYAPKSYIEHLRSYGDVTGEREDETGVDVEEIDDAIRDLEDRLNAIAPDGYYFGAHPGDGADFGFWRSEDTPDASEDTDPVEFDSP